MKTIWIAAALAVLTLATSSSVARADQTLRFDIAGAGRIVGPGLDCIRSTPFNPTTGDCADSAVDGPPDCSEQFCIPNPGTLSFRAVDLDGFRFDHWSHPQCGAGINTPPFTLNPCTVLVALGAGNPDLSVTATFVDVQPPAVTITAPADGAAVRGLTVLTASATDNGGLGTLDLFVNGSPAPPTRLDTRTLADGPATISARATDLAGNSGTAAVTVIVDNTNPTLALTGPADGAVLRRGSTATWQIAAADAATSVTVACSVVPQGQTPVFGACTSPTQESAPTTRRGTFTLTVRATDRAGNAVQQTRAFTVR